MKPRVNKRKLAFNCRFPYRMRERITKTKKKKEEVADGIRILRPIFFHFLSMNRLIEHWSRGRDLVELPIVFRKLSFIYQWHGMK